MPGGPTVGVFEPQEPQQELWGFAVDGSHSMGLRKRYDPRPRTGSGNVRSPNKVAFELLENLAEFEEVLEP